MTKNARQPQILVQPSAQTQSTIWQAIEHGTSLWRLVMSLLIVINAASRAALLCLLLPFFVAMPALSIAADNALPYH